MKEKKMKKKEKRKKKMKVTFGRVGVGNLFTL